MSKRNLNARVEVRVKIETLTGTEVKSLGTDLSLYDSVEKKQEAIAFLYKSLVYEIFGSDGRLDILHGKKLPSEP